MNPNRLLKQRRVGSGLIRPGLVRPGLRLPRHRTTTAHACALYPFHTNPGIGTRGLYVGTDITAGGTPWHYDPFQAYADGTITSPNITILGMVGTGKSTAVKTLLYRTLGLLGTNTQPRWAAIIDPKGEYGPLAHALGLTHIHLKPGGTTRLNPLDPPPLSSDPTANTSDLAGRQTAMTTALAATMAKRDLTPTEDAAITWTINALTQATSPQTKTTQVPTLHDVAHLLANPTTDMVGRSHCTTPQELARQLADLRYAITKLLDGPLKGMFDGPSTIQPNWEGRGIVIDLSAIHHDPDALTPVMIAATGWLQTLLATPTTNTTPKRIQVLEEIWALLGNPAVARYYQTCQKLSRSYGVANISVAHRISDLRAQTDDGTAATKISTGLLADTQTRILFRQSTDQIPEATELLGLTPTEAQVMPQLAKGRALWQVGDHTAIVQHRVASGEWPICDTDQQLVG